MKLVLGVRHAQYPDHSDPRLPTLRGRRVGDLCGPGAARYSLPILGDECLGASTAPPDVALTETPQAEVA